MPRRSARALALAAVLLGAASPAWAAGTVTELFLGLSTPAGPVTAEDWDRFMVEDMAPRLPGFAVTPCDGLYRAADGAVVRESCKRVVIVHDGQGAAISAVIAVYKTRFAQESVLRLDRACGDGCVFE